MIKFNNIKHFKDIPFDQYVSSPGYSYSFLKRELNGTSPEFIGSEKVELGKLVDAILTQPDDIDIYSPQLKRAEAIAECIQSNFGNYIKHFESQVSMTSDMNYLGLTMPFRGRLDWGLKDIAVIDLKVTAETNFKAIIEHMRYDDQLFGYCGAYGVKLAYILMYSSKSGKLDLIERPLNNGEFWKDKIMKFGTVNQEPIYFEEFNPKILLKPLSSISDEDAEYVARIMEPEISIEDLKENLSNKEFLVRCLLSIDRSEFELEINPLSILKMYQYLQSKGYALPYLDYSVEDLVNLNVYQLETN